MHEGNQRLSLQRLKVWEEYKYGMFIHFGMSTFVESEFPSGNDLSELYAPDCLDVDQWIRVARDAGMKYAILCSKHTSGHCLWPSKYTDYHVGTSGNKTDVVREFMAACQKYNIQPGIYYCSWDNHHLYGSLTPNSPNGSWQDAYVTEEYIEFQEAQITELFTTYAGIKEFWLDIPKFIPAGVRRRWYKKFTAMNPDMVYVSNNGISDGNILSVNDTWPTDIVTIEKTIPSSITGYNKWKQIEGDNYYLPGEVCDTISKEWFYVENDTVKSDNELLGLYLLATSRGTNLLLDVPPDRHGVITKEHVNALLRLRANIDLLG